MAQTNNSDYFLANQSGKDFRDELNEILADIKSNNSSSGPPSSSASIPHVEGQMYYDTDNSGELMVCTAGGNPGTFKKVDTNTQRTNSEINTLITAGITGKANTSHTHTGSTISSLAAGDTTSGTFVETLLGTGTATGGHVLTAGSGTTASWQAASGGIGKIEVFNNSGNWNRPAGVNKIWVTVCGGGGGGAGGNSSENQGGTGHGGSGGAGGAVVDRELTVNNNNAISYAVGNGGGGSARASQPSDGTTGGKSHFGGSTNGVIGNGGPGGQWNTGNGAQGRVGGNGSFGNQTGSGGLTTKGGSGGHQGSGITGGASIMGGGGARSSSINSSPAAAALGSGGGSGKADVNAGNASHGGTGGKGFIIVKY